MVVVFGCSLTRTWRMLVPASINGPAKHVRYLITQLADNPHTVMLTVRFCISDERFIF